MLTQFINKPDYLSDLTIFIISFISSLEIINVLLPDQNILLWIAASVADAAAINPNGFKMLLVNGFSTHHIKGNPVFSNGPKSLPKNLPDCPMLCNWVFDNFILSEESFAKVLWSLETCVLVNNNLCGKLFSLLESPTIFYEIFKVTSVPIVILDFSLLSCALDTFTCKLLFWVILYSYNIKTK